jgi:hypothetical protein
VPDRAQNDPDLGARPLDRRRPTGRAIRRFGWGLSSARKALTEGVRPSDRLRGDRVAPGPDGYLRHRVGLAVS